MSYSNGLQTVIQSYLVFPIEKMLMRKLWLQQYTTAFFNKVNTGTVLGRYNIAKLFVSSIDSQGFGLCVARHTRPSLYGLLCDFCSSVREFARQGSSP